MVVWSLRLKSGDLGTSCGRLDGHALVGASGESRENVVELSNVAGPVIDDEFCDGFVFDFKGCWKRRELLFVDEPVVDEQGNIFAPLSERGDWHFEDGKAVIKIFAELTFRNHLLKIAGRGGDDP